MTPTPGEHSRGVVQLALEVAEELHLDEQTRRRVDFGAMLHDVGKVAIPKEIINKPGPLDPDEWDIVKTHTTEGQRMLDQVGGSDAQHRADRPRPPRALGRHGVPGRIAR